MVEVNADENNFSTRGNVIGRPEGSGHDLEVRASLLPGVRNAQIGIDPAVPLGTYKAGASPQGGK